MVPLKKGHHEILRGIKAVTYHQIALEETPDGWEVRVILTFRTRIMPLMDPQVYGNGSDFWR
jgi:hypothetical protein